MESVKVPCAECGKPVYKGHDSRPEPVCQQCRRERAMRACKQCGREFRAGSVRPSAPFKYCSVACRTAARSLSPDERKARKQAQTRARRLRHDQTWDGVTDQQVFVRDDWQCQVPGCGFGPLRRDLAWPDALSPSIDHIVPLSRGGTDVAPNKRAAHLYCNVSRHNRMTPDEEKLVMPELAPLGLLPVTVRPPGGRKPGAGRKLGQGGPAYVAGKLSLAERAVHLQWLHDHGLDLLSRLTGP